jgi:hypothetical protein
MVSLAQNRGRLVSTPWTIGRYSRFVASLTVERPLCLACIAHKSGASQLDALRAIERMGLIFSLDIQQGDQCRACGSTVGPVYSLIPGR